jgi:periplasmic protein TonB
VIQKRTKRNNSKVNIIVSLVVHGVVIFVVFFLAAREGLVGKKLKQLAVTMVPKEKKPEPPKEKPPEPKVEPPKSVETVKVAEQPPPPVQNTAPPPPSTPVTTAPPVAAPAAVSLPAFTFNDGAKDVQSISDPNGVYKALVEHTLRSRWNRPEDMADDNFVAEVEVRVNPSGRILDYRWVSGSGNKRWDDSVKAAMEDTKSIDRPPPKGFPEKFDIKFDVISERTEPVINLSVQ